MDAFIHVYVLAAVVLFIAGFVWKGIRFAVDIRRYGLGLPDRSDSPYSNPTRSMIETFRISFVAPYSAWHRTNPWMFYGHILYHLGFFTGIASYFLVAVMSWPRLSALPLADALIRVCTWTEYQELWPSASLKVLFSGSLVFACVGIATPLVLSAIGKRGAIRAPHASVAEEFTPIPRDPRWTSVRVQRKVIAGVVLVMDGLLFIHCCRTGTAWMTRIHLILFWSIFAVFPYTFLAHEIWRVGELFRFIRIRRGIAV